MMEQGLPPPMRPASTDQNEPNTELGLLPRVIAAGWFALAACVPVIFFFAVFARRDNGPVQSDSQGWWFLGGLPVSIAALLGFTIGSRILDVTRRRSAARAMMRGMVVGISSYLGLVVLNICLVIIFSGNQSIRGGSIGSAVWWILIVYGIGAIYVGWLILIAGGWAGFLLHLASRVEILRVPVMKAPRVSKNVLSLWTGLVAFVLVVANCLVLLVLKW